MLQTTRITKVLLMLFTHYLRLFSLVGSEFDFFFDNDTESYTAYIHYSVGCTSQASAIVLCIHGVYLRSGSAISLEKKKEGALLFPVCQGKEGDGSEN